MVWHLLDNDAAALGDAINGHLDRGKSKDVGRGVHVVHKLEHSKTSNRGVHKSVTSYFRV